MQIIPNVSRGRRKEQQNRVLGSVVLGISQNFIVHHYTPDIRSMWGYIVFAFPFVRTFVRSSFRHRVKVFALKFIRPHILKTL